MEARDLFQEVLYQVWRSLPSFKGESNIDTWVYQITLNTCYALNIRQKKTNHNTVPLDGIEIAADEPSLSEVDRVRYDALQACISTLDELERSVIVLMLEQLPYKAISAISGLSENHVAVKVKRIKNLLLGCLRKKLAT